MKTYDYSLNEFLWKDAFGPKGWYTLLHIEVPKHGIHWDDPTAKVEFDVDRTDKYGDAVLTYTSETMDQETLIQFAHESINLVIGCGELFNEEDLQEQLIAELESASTDEERDNIAKSWHDKWGIAQY